MKHKKQLFFHGFHAAESLRFSVYAYLAAQEKRGLSRSTICQRLDSLKLFTKWIETNATNTLLEITLSHLEDYQAWLRLAPPGRKEKLQSQRTIQTRLLDVRLFFRWLIKNQMILTSPASGWDIAHKPSVTLPECLTENQVAHLLKIPDLNTPYGLRDRAILETFYSTGIRRAELIGLDRQDINPGEGLLSIRKGKGGKQRLVPVGSRALSFIYHYQNHPFFFRHATYALFINRPGNRVGGSLIEKIIQTAKTAAGIKIWGAAHLLRHACATHMLKNGADIRIIQEILGHADIETTMIYTHLNIQHLKEIHRKTHPAEIDHTPGALF